MAYGGAVRIQIYNLVAEALESILYFKQVHKQMPTSPPTAHDNPQAFLALLPETMAGITNKERESDFQMAVILFVHAEKNIDEAKLEGIAKAENVINNLQTDATFESIASIIHVQTTDPGPLALSVFGLDWQVLPPLGVVRMDVLAQFIYQAFD